MKTKLKDFILYSLAIVGAVTLFINATTNSQQTISTVPESHVWEMEYAYSDGSNIGRMYAINKQTGEVRKYSFSYPNLKKVAAGTTYITMVKADK